ncbi:MAG: tetratricopeptide repeat protein [Chloroflexi bacterium]|nr:tetratricopeptide repeat protein [Chloroflexota bacterium]
MMVYKAEDKARLRRDREREAIAFAMQGKWKEALAANAAILDLFPEDVEAYNRQGKAYLELGRYREAKEAFEKAIRVSPNNAIAKKNLQRLEYLGQQKKAAPRGEEQRAPASLFIEETGKTTVTELASPAQPKVLAQVNAGDAVDLAAQKNELIAKTPSGVYLGRVEPRIALRLIKLLQGGNRYAAAVTRVSERSIKIIIKEVFQHPSQAGKVSFPAHGPEDLRRLVADVLPTYEEVSEGEEEEDEEVRREFEREWEEEEEEFSSVEGKATKGAAEAEEEEEF